MKQAAFNRVQRGLEMTLARQVMARIDSLAGISEERGRLTRRFASAAMRDANKLVGSWMRQAGMSVRQDAIGNLIGHYPAAHSNRSASQARKSKILVLGSHLDTVVDAGKFDGPLGVLIGIACVERLRQTQTLLPFAIEVAGFADEEGVRYQSTYLGSRAMAGTFHTEDLRLKDANGTTMAEAIRSFGGDPRRVKSAKLESKRVLGYVEAHIEQGPVLEEHDLAVAVVSGISGQARFRVRFSGKAGHAGTVPMSLRQDALCAAAEFVLAVETEARRSKGLVATVGGMNVRPGASNVIPGEVNLTVDIRHPNTSVRRRAEARVSERARSIGRSRQIGVEVLRVHEADSAECDQQLSKLLEKAVKHRQGKLVRLASGAGHDAAAMAAITPVAMLFVRCKGGISHHPDESIKRQDVAIALSVMGDFINLLARHG